jgi:hydrogenase maturation protein HypF
LRTVAKLAQKGLGSPLTSSCGRMFDAVSALLGICIEPTYEGQTAAELEMVAYAARSEKRKTKSESAGWQFDIRHLESAILVDPFPVFRGIVADMSRRVSVSETAFRFHQAVASAVIEICMLARRSTKLNTVALSGGCFQNKLLTEMCLSGLQRRRFRVLTHSKVPANDGGISLGQAMVAAASMVKARKTGTRTLG